MMTETAVSPDTEQRFDCLDGIRAMAALMVMAFHFMGYHAADRLIVKASVIGQTGVDLFFVLSGFLITRILLLSRESPRFFRTFYVRRTLRIFPLYYGFLLLYFFVLPPLQGNEIPAFNQEVWAWAYLENVASTFPQFHSAGPQHFWSLAVEEHFYLFWPLLVHALSRRQFLVAIAAALVVPVILRALLISQGIGVYYLTPTRLDALAFGGLLAVLFLDGTWLARHPHFFRWLLAILGPGLLLAFTRFSGTGYGWLGTVKLTLIPAFYFALIGFCLTDAAARPLTASFSLRWLRWLGGISYGLYVFHVTCFSLLAHFLAPLPLLPAMAVSFAATVLVAWVSYRFFEAPILRLKRYFTYT